MVCKGADSSDVPASERVGDCREIEIFDSHRHSPSDTEVSHALAVAKSQNLIDKFVYLDLVPSSCFATTREKWAEFGDTEEIKG